MSDKKRLLLVDDEPAVLKVMERIMRLSLDCEITTATSGQEGLAIMETKPFDAVISDFKMPGMDGAEFLDVVQELYPSTTRLIFSARSGGDCALRTIGSAHQYFLKPTDLNVITQKIERVFKLRSLLPEQGLERVVSHIHALPSLPAIYSELEAEIRRPDASGEKIGHILERDVSMSAKVLQMVNSAFFGLRDHVSRPSAAAALLGISMLKALVLAAHVFSEWRDDVPGFSINQLSGHCQKVAEGARRIALAEGLNRERADEFYVAGLFHDIGKLVIASHLPQSYQAIGRVMGDSQKSEIDAEKEVMGTTHGETGAYLMALWGFSEEVVTCCAFHHHPSESIVHGFSPLVAVHVANAFDRKVPTKPEDQIDMAYLEKEGLSNRLPAWGQACVNG